MNGPKNTHPPLSMGTIYNKVVRACFLERIIDILTQTDLTPIH